MKRIAIAAVSMAATRAPGSAALAIAAGTNQAFDSLHALC
ncbi:hypothetical protein O981_19485 [Mycobacterium avium 10-5560]|nr:hypothetical protein O981_19485 [Mycobacterium avium 10-5560]